MAEMDFLSKVYELETDRDIFDLYTKWAESYEQDVIKNGYRTPERCASDLANATTHRSLSILDMGCGTGYSGLALQKAGFSNIDGTDINPAMLEMARSRNIYNNVYLGTIEKPLPENISSYSAISAIGVIGSGAAPVDLLREISGAISLGALFVFSLNEHTLRDPAFVRAIEECVDKGVCDLVSRSTGPHLEKLNTTSAVFVLKKI